MSDNREILNDAEVDFLLSAAAGDEPATPRDDRQVDGQTVTMRGDLDQIQLADIFQTLAMAKMEGVLLVRNPLEERQVYCHNGTVRIKVPSRIALRRLGQRLVQAGLLEPEQLRSTLVRQRKERRPLGELLVQEGLLTQDQIDEVAGMQVAEDLFALFTWRHGTFEFYKGELTDPQQVAAFETCPEFEVNSLLLEVARRSDEWDGILAVIGNLDEVPHRIAEPAEPESLGEVHRTLLYGADGQTTYRALTEQTTQSLFEAARCARDLVQGGLLANVDDLHLAQVALHQAEEGQEKRAIVLLQTLRDRPGDRDLAVVQTMAQALERAGERRLAGNVLLEAAQLQTDPEHALAMARRARDLAPRDPGTNSFLRTVLLAHSPPDSPELEKCTIDLLDALLEADLTKTALEIVEDARATGTLRPQVLVREARARQKLRDTEGAIAALTDLAAHYEAAADRPRLIETLESILRLDRARTDVKKRLHVLRQTRIGRIVRLAAILTCSVLLGGSGLVLWRQHAFDQAVKQADAEIGEMLQAGNRTGARECWERWSATLGECEPIEDLRSRIDFADAAERTRLEKLQRRRVADRLTAAGGALAAGDVRGSMAIYRELWQDPKLRPEVAEAATSRMQALLDKVEQTAKTIAHSLPPEPSTLLDRRDLTAHRDDLHAICPPSLLAFFVGLDRSSGELPEFLAEPVRERIATLLPQTRAVYARTAQLAAAYEEALQRNEHERRLDPMFKAAVGRENAFDFPGALELYRQLEQAPAGDAALKAHFRDRVARNATICRLMADLQQATAAADFAAAQQQLRALQAAYPDVPFDRLVRLPLRVESYPTGAQVTCNGSELGNTPLTLSYVPAVETTIAVTLPGYRAARTAIRGDRTAAWVGHLVLAPTNTLAFDHAVEQGPCLDGERLVFADRGGFVSAFDRRDGSLLWRFGTGDLSGYLSRPLAHGPVLLVASLDGELRALDRASGALAWTLPNLPTEVTPALVGDSLLLASTNRRLHCIDLADRSSFQVSLPEAAHGDVLAAGRTVLCIGQRGTVSAFTLPGLAPLWQTTCRDCSLPWATLAGSRLVVADDRGRLRCLDIASGRTVWSVELDVEVLGPALVIGDLVLLPTPERIERRLLATGAAKPAIARLEANWAGPLQRVASRLVLPLAGGGLQVLDAADGSPAYRLDGHARSVRCLAQDDVLFVVRGMRSVDCYPQMR
ncbi:MAG: PQQ-binding-like beta-propeller repeat protein [Planctomycetes bacterium]|nr:PQQ-binding-like beta-propeller repeat protein [Planctomycetota bacterium]